MDLSSTSKRIPKTIILALLFFVLLLALLYPFLGRLALMTGLVNGPYDYPGSIWVCTEPEIYLQISPSGIVEDSICYVVVDGIKIQANLYVQPDREWVLIQPKEQTAQSSINLLMGNLIRCTNDRVVFEVVEDELYSGKYKEITLILQR